METSTISRRELLKGTGALVVSFSLFGPAARALAQAAAGGGEPEASSLDSWLAIAQDGTVTVFTSKVELGRGRKQPWRRSSRKNWTCPSAGFIWRRGTRRRAWTRPSRRPAEPSSERDL